MKSRTFLNILSLALLAPLCLAPLYAQDDAADAEPKKVKRKRRIRRARKAKKMLRKPIQTSSATRFPAGPTRTPPAAPCSTRLRTA
jgi:hypothetical protein